MNSKLHPLKIYKSVILTGVYNCEATTRIKVLDPNMCPGALR